MTENSRPEEESQDLREEMAEGLDPQAAAHEISTLRARASDLEQQNLRLLADFDNFRRRQQRAEEELRGRARQDAVTALLPLADDLERALQAAAEDDPLRAGVAMVERGLQAVLQRFGAEVIPSVGEPFDPALHEAVGEDESDLAPGTVTAELRRGYRIEDRVARPAMVRVARARE